MEVTGQLSARPFYHLAKTPSYHGRESWVGATVSLEIVGKRKALALARIEL
jgi:hypothetical protein